MQRANNFSSAKTLAHNVSVTVIAKQSFKMTENRLDINTRLQQWNKASTSKAATKTAQWRYAWPGRRCGDPIYWNTEDDCTMETVDCAAQTGAMWIICKWEWQQWWCWYASPLSHTELRIVRTGNSIGGTKLATSEFSLWQQVIFFMFGQNVGLQSSFFTWVQFNHMHTYRNLI